uniref:PH domain-containing protein n=1 Tax=Mesocestoides corti TaxID=53468 RepID=A0A5K3FUY8_MESCO
MDSELTELDDWVGTLEELQLGLERKCPSAATAAAAVTTSNRLKPKSSYSGPHHLTRATPASSPSPWRVAQILDSPTPPPLPPGRGARLSPPGPPQSPPERPPRSRCDESPRHASEACQTNSFTQSIRASFNPLSCQEATAENDLNCLLRHLEEVENTMRQLEQDDGGFTRRYSLASSSTTDPNTGCNPSPAPDTPEQLHVAPEPPPPPAERNGDTAVGGEVSSDQQGTLQLSTKPALPPRRFYRRTPSPQNTDYELTDEVSTAAFLSSTPDLNGSLNPSVASASPSPAPARVVPHDGGLIDNTTV